MQTLPQSLLIWGAPQPSFTLLWSPPFLPPMAPTPRNWPSTPPPRPSCPHREMGPGPSQAPCLCVFLHPPILQGQASRASPVAVKALVREASPHMGSPFLTHPPSMQTTAPLPTPGLTDPHTCQLHPHLPPHQARHPLLYTPPHSPHPYACAQTHTLSLPHSVPCGPTSTRLSAQDPHSQKHPLP